MKKKIIIAVFKYSFLCVLVAIAIGPFFYLLNTSLQETSLLMGIGEPEYTFNNYIRLFTELPFMRWILNSVVFAALVVVLIIFIDTLGLKRSAGYGGVALIFVPSIVMYFLKRAYPLYRVTDCPYCGYHAKQKLGHSSS